MRRSLGTLMQALALAALLVPLPAAAQTTAQPSAQTSATPRSLLVGVYDTEKGAEKAFKELKEVEKTKAISIDAYAVVSKDAKGNVHVSNTQQRDRRFGAIAGGIIGLLVMGPAGAPIGGAVGGAGLGGLTGWLAGEHVGIPRSDINNIKEALVPNSSAVVAVVDNKWVADVEAALKKQATKAYIKSELKEQKEDAATAH